MVVSLSSTRFRRAAGICAIGLAGLVGSALAEGPAQNPEQPRQIVVRLSRDVFTSLVETEIDKTTTVSDFILGARISGRSRTTGLPRVKLVDDANRATFVITFQGTNVSRTTGRNGPAIVQTRADTQFVATKRIIFQSGTGFVAEPAKITAQTRTTTEGISATRRGWIGRLIVRRASRQVAASRQQVDAIARQRAETRISAAFDEYLATRLARANQALDFRQPVALLLGADGEPRFATSTTSEYMQIVASRPDDGDQVELPANGPKTALLQLWARQSVLGDQMLPVLDRLEEGRPAATLPGRAIEVAGALVKQLGLPADPSDAARPLAYDRVGDWLVVQVGSRAAAAEPGTAANVVTSAPRMWTSVDGRFTCEAMLVSATAQEVTLKRSADGKVVTVPLWRLSEADRKTIQ